TDVAGALTAAPAPSCVLPAPRRPPSAGRPTAGRGAPRTSSRARATWRSKFRSTFPAAEHNSADILEHHSAESLGLRPTREPKATGHSAKPDAAGSGADGA